MEFISFLLIFGVVLIALKLFGLVFRTSIFLIALPLQILGGLIITIFFFAVLPVVLITGALAIILAPLGILAPFFPFFLIGLGIYLLTRNR